MRHLFYIIPVFILASLLLTYLPEKNTTVRKVRHTKEQRIDGAMADRLFTSSDINTGELPVDKLIHAIKEGKRRLQHPSPTRSLRGNLTEAIWRERGPNNIGGRTRAIHVDESDPDRNRVWIGGVSGGIWLTEDITRPDPEWRKMGNYFESISIGDIAQDQNDHQIMYVGTGESYTNDFLSVGMYKSVDGGENWTALENTKNFGAINEIYTHHNGDVYALSSAVGLYRSKDKGESWERLLGVGAGANSSDMHDFMYHPVNETFYVSNDFSLYKSTTGDADDWVNIGQLKPGFPTNLSRVEFAICPSNPNIIFVLGAFFNNSASNTYVSTDGGETWSARSAPGIMPGQDFTNGQAWYDLDITVDPDNCLRLLAGGVPLMESISQGTGWQFPAANEQVHVDHHHIAFDEKKADRVYYGNDGGIWISNNAGASILNKNTGYITTQFYCGAIHPDPGSPYLLGGTQDNSSLQITEPGLSPANSVWGGDGMFCFIDQDEPDIQIVSSQFGNYGISRDGGESFDGGTSVNGGFVNRSAYDDKENLLYGQVSTDGFEYFRWDVDNSTTQEVNIQGHFLDVTAVEIDPRISNRVFFGGESGRIIRVDNAHTGTTVNGTLIADLDVGNASVSSIYMDSVSSDDILVSIFNYGAGLDNVWVTTNGGDDWTSIEGDLPDLPVRWAIFDPANHDRAMIATDAGVWTTDNIDGDNTHWEPSNPDNGMAFVRVDMLVMRNSDKTVLAATHGRGLLTTDVFSQPAAVIIAQPIAYEGQSIVIDGSQSVNAQDFEWSLGDNTTSNETVFNHTYTDPGTYTIKLKINGEVTVERTIAVLPYLPAPYTPGVNDYTGDFETHPEHFAAYTVQGTGFQRGASLFAGKDGTHSGSKAWVLGINENLYQPNTRAEFYTPQYDLSEPGLYELKFWTKYAVQNRNDGFQVEYSTDGGASWTQLGSRSDPSWYNYLNQTLDDGAFPIGKSYFTDAKLDWVKYSKDISFLGGQSRVSFRYVFRSDSDEQNPGLAIDDFEITKFDGELRTTVTVFDAAYINDQEVEINWTTGIEYQADRFVLERSFSGFDFDSITSLNAKGGISTLSFNYKHVDPVLRNIIYYRVKVINDNPAIPYHLEFYTDTVVVRRSGNAGVVNAVVKNPFRDKISVSFSSVIDQEVTLRLFDVAGRMVLEDVQNPNSVTVSLDNLWFPPGIYVLSIQVGDEEPKAYKLFTEGGSR